ncbi:ArnT family glycosyltransferase [Streptomyces sp. AHA2]|uniref:ArnT family glycosyltransferase n=1 Tax=Streptomyces sp. AHA2 TaxID=3064526 RepID=UPI002FE22F2F
MTVHHRGPAGGAGSPSGTGPRHAAPEPAPEVPRRPLPLRLRRGRPEDPRWARPAFLALLLATALLYLWNLSASGYANSFYSAAVQAGSQSWKAFFFGSLDAANAITVDKPPAALWPMALSVRLFGLGSWAILVPEVLMGVGTVAVVYAAVRRRFAPAAGLIAGAVLALTPVAALMFRFNNPDAMLALLTTLACYFVLRALEDGRTRWLVWAGAAIGFAFLAKTLQAFLILPPLALVYGVCAPVPVKRRIGQLAAGLAAILVSGGWWVAIVELWPASSRPYVGGSQNDSFLELTFGYNGLGRLDGDETGSVGGQGGGGRGGSWGETGWDRLFGSSLGGQISWLIPAALLLLIAALVATRGARRTSATRGAFLLWGGALITTMLVFSYMRGIFHEYYTVALAPCVAALTGMGAVLLWEQRHRVWASLVLAGATTATAAWGYVLLDRSSGYLPWLKWCVLAGGLTAALGLVFAGRLGRWPALGVAGLGLAAALAGPAAYTLTTVNQGHSGSIVTAGPAVTGGRGLPGGGPGGDGLPGGGPSRRDGTGTAQAQPGEGFPGGGMPGQGGSRQGGRAPGQPGRAGGGGGASGLLDGASVSKGAKQLLTTDADRYTWVAAAVGAQNAASYQLSTGEAVMAVGGFNGTDPSPTLAQFRRYVADGRIHYFVASGTGGGTGAGDGTSAQITSWVEANFTEVTVGSSTFYDLTRAAGG